MPQNPPAAISSPVVYVVLVMRYRIDFTSQSHVSSNNHMPGKNFRNVEELWNSVPEKPNFNSQRLGA